MDSQKALGVRREGDMHTLIGGLAGCRDTHYYSRYCYSTNGALRVVEASAPVIIPGMTKADVDVILPH
jgi:hypothetical protein